MAREKKGKGKKKEPYAVLRVLKALNFHAARNDRFQRCLQQCSKDKCVLRDLSEETVLFC